MFPTLTNTAELEKMLRKDPEVSVPRDRFEELIREETELGIICKVYMAAEYSCEVENFLKLIFGDKPPKRDGE